MHYTHTKGQTKSGTKEIHKFTRKEVQGNSRIREKHQLPLIFSITFSAFSIHFSFLSFHPVNQLGHCTYVSRKTNLRKRGKTSPHMKLSLLSFFIYLYREPSRSKMKIDTCSSDLNSTSIKINMVCLSSYVTYNKNRTG